MSSTKLVGVVVAALLAWTAADFALGEEMPGKCERSYLLPRPYETNATEETLNDIILEAKCLFNCINVRDRGIYTMNYTHPSWPTLQLEDSARCNTRLLGIQTCMEGCAIRFRGDREGPCGGTCNLNCSRGCTGQGVCDFPVRTNINSHLMGCRNVDCPKKKQEFYCQVGCSYLFPDGRGTPTLPIAPMELHPLYTKGKGMFSIKLNSSSERSEDLTGFLFRVEDLMSKNVSYIWKIPMHLSKLSLKRVLLHVLQDATELLDLSSYTCRRVSVSLSLVNIVGQSSFTNSVELFIEGDVTLFPSSAPEDVQITDFLNDTVFQLVQLNITWTSLINDSKLDYFDVTVTPSDNCNSTNYSPSLKVWKKESTSNYSVDAYYANPTIEAPAAACTYKVEVSARNRHGKRSTSIYYSIGSLQDYADQILTDFTCLKEMEVHNLVTPPEPYFKFHLNWIMGQYLSDVDSAVVEFVIYNSRTGKTRNEHTPTTINVTEISQYNFLVTPYMDFSRPRRNPDELFEIKLRINWKDKNAEGIESSCLLSALSPAPSKVENLVVNSLVAKSSIDVEVSVDWEKPTEANGVLSSYQFCLAAAPLRTHDSPSPSSSSCRHVSSERTSIEANFNSHFPQHDEFVYVQVRAFNTYTSGNWSESIQIPKPKYIDYKIIISSITVGVAVFLVAAMLAVVFGVQYYKVANIRKKVEDGEPFQTMKVSKGSTHLVLEAEDSCSDQWEVLPANVTVEDNFCLGQGNFGVVYKGLLVRSQLRHTHTPVAIKMLKENATSRHKSMFLNEIEVMKNLSQHRHPNVLALVGCVVMQEPFYLLTEFVSQGDLHSYLKYLKKSNMEPSQMSSIAPSEITNFSFQIAKGMDFISSKGIVHCDLAARNILIAQGKLLKIADFGLSCFHTEHERVPSQQSNDDVSCQSGSIECQMFSKEHQVPLKWMPPEYIELRKISFALDVWSFGVVVWEISNPGENPYCNVLSNHLLQHLKNGGRLENPDNALPEVYDIMQSCWLKEPSERPSFDSLKRTITKLITSKEKSSKYYYDLCDCQEDESTSSVGSNDPKSTSLSFIGSSNNATVPKSNNISKYQLLNVVTLSSSQKIENRYV